MTTYYTATPTLEERVTGANLIIIGRVADVVGERKESFEHEVFIRTTYMVIVEEIIKGETTLKRLRVETPGEKPLNEGETMVFMLAQDAGQEHQADQFVPYFGSVYPLEGKSRVSLRPTLSSHTAIQAAPEGLEQIALDDLRELTRKVTTMRREAEQQSLELEAEHLKAAQVEYPQEMPQGQFGGGTPASVLPAEPPDTERKD